MPVILLLITAVNGQHAPVISWQNTIGGDATDQLFSMKQTNNDGYILGGYSISGMSCEKTENTLGYFDYWIVKLGADIQTGIGAPPQPGTGDNWCYPNPATAVLCVEGNKNENLSISNLIGEEVRATTVLSGENGKTQLDISALAPGIYFIRSGNAVMKFVKQ